MSSSAEAPARPSPPRGTRAGWLLAALAFLASTALPWSCNMSPVQHAIRWGTGPGAGDRALALSIVLPLLLLVAVATLEARSRRYRAPTLAPVALTALAALGIVAFSDALPQRVQAEGGLIALGLPRPIVAWSGASRALVRLLLLAPAAAMAAWGLAVARSLHGAPLAARWLASYTAASLALVWGIACEGFGYWAGVTTAAAMTALATLVPDAAPSPGPRTRRALALAGVLCLALLAALMLGKRGDDATRLMVGGLR